MVGMLQYTLAVINICQNQKGNSLMSTTPTQFTPPAPKFLSTKGAKKFLHDYADLNYSDSRFFALTFQGKIPCRKGPTGRLLFPIDELKAWVDGNDANGEA